MERKGKGEKIEVKEEILEEIRMKVSERKINTMVNVKRRKREKR